VPVHDFQFLEGLLVVADQFLHFDLGGIFGPVCKDIIMVPHQCRLTLPDLCLQIVQLPRSNDLCFLESNMQILDIQLQLCDIDLCPAELILGLRETIAGYCGLQTQPFELVCVVLQLVMEVGD
jgi:hypothetical protein